MTTIPELEARMEHRDRVLRMIAEMTLGSDCAEIIERCMMEFDVKLKDAASE